MLLVTPVLEVKTSALRKVTEDSVNLENEVCLSFKGFFPLILTLEIQSSKDRKMFNCYRFV